MKRLSFLFIYLLQNILSQTLKFPIGSNSDPYSFELDGFQVSRGYFSPLSNKQQCQNINNGDCIYSNFINTPNLLFLPSSSSPETFSSSYKLSNNEAIVIAGFAPPKSQYFTITPYAHYTNDVQTYASISNHSLYLNSTYFVVVISGDLYTIDLINDWFENANTTLTTAIYNNYLYELPIVQSNPDLNINENTEYSVIIRHETIRSNEEDLKYVFSQSPSLLSWHVTALNFDDIKSEIVTELNQMRETGNNEKALSLTVIPTKNHNKYKEIVTFDTTDFDVVNYDSSECLSTLTNCNADQPESVVFESPVFNIGYRTNIKIFVSGINHIQTENAVYSTINIIENIDRSIITQISLNDIPMDGNNNNDDGYLVVFAENCEDIDIFCEEIENMVDLCGIDLQIVEIIANEIGIDESYLQPPTAVVAVEKKRKRKRRRKHRNSNRKKSDEEEERFNRENSPNVVMIILDDLGWKDVGYNGAEFATPNIDNLANTGMIFNRYYVHPVCSPTRTALYTGRYSFRYNMSIPLDIGQRRYLPPNVDTLQEVLSANGYDTHLVGKWHVGNPLWEKLPFSRGFDTFYGFSGGFIDYYTHEQCWEAWDGPPYPRISGDNNLRLLNAFYPKGICVYDFWDEKKLDVNNEYFTGLFAKRAMDIISSKNSKTSSPFFMVLSLGTPHTPIVEAPEIFNECITSLSMYGSGRYDYCNMILSADKLIGEIVDKLKDEELWDNTVLIFSTDNGGIGRTVPGNIIFDSFGNNLPLRGSKSSPFEGGNRGVAFINGGYLNKYNLNGTVNNKLYHVVDWYSTIIYGIAGITNYIDNSGDILDSFNIWDSIINHDILSPRNEWIWSVNFGPSPTAITQNNWKLITNPQPFLDGYWNINNRTLGPGQNIDETIYLFNITNDEEEFNNLKDLYPNIVSNLQNRLLSVRNEGFTMSNDVFEIEGFVIAILSGTSLPYLELTQEIKINTN